MVGHPHCIFRYKEAGGRSSLYLEIQGRIELVPRYISGYYKCAHNPMADAIKALLDFMKLRPAALLGRARQIYTAMKGNPAFIRPTISMEALGAQIETYADCIVEASDGSRKAIAARDRQGDVLKGMLRQLAAYVEFVSETDVATFTSSGYRPAANVRTKSPPLSESIRKIEFGWISGEVRVKAVAIAGADSYELRWAPRPREGIPDEWKTQPFGQTREYLTITGLTPGTFYLFQVRALIGKQFTDWSDSVTKMSK